jgi:myo-inositol 2-dehydrogenase/D-chiro-inositol 1-dehydrogenase
MSNTDLRIGIIGVGMMGADHALRVAERTANATLVAVSDVDGDRAAALAGTFDGVRAIPDAAALIADDDIDAVIIASPGFAHEEQLMDCLAHRRYAMCEKPLTMDSASSLRVLQAERDGGAPLFQVGFMRRFDPEYSQMKSVLDSGSYGRTLLLHNVHRNKSVPSTDFRSEMIVRDSLVHEVDVARFLFGEEIATIQVLSPAASSLAAPGVLDPQIALFTMAGGAMAVTEVFVNCQVGYEVRCEAVAERGTLTAGLTQNGPYGTRAAADPDQDGSWGGHVPLDYRTRFARAYDLEIQAWVDACRRGTVVGPNSWDGYAATAVCTAGIQSLVSGEPVQVELTGATDTAAATV